MPNPQITFFNTHVTPRAIELATAALQSGMLSEGARVKEFEAALASQLGMINPIALNSGTTALHLALVLAGVGPGDEVILPAQTFVATGLVILMQGAIPVFADIDPDTGNIAPASIAAAITPRTRAIMPVHWAGYPCEMDEINAVAAKHNIAVVEDAAHALGATYRGKPIGAISRFTAFSFQAIKHLTTGDGGALCCTNAADERAARTRRWFGIDRATAQPSILGERSYDIDAVGYKYHLNDLAAAVGLGNLDGFPARLARRRQIANTYRDALATIPGITLLKSESDRQSAHWLFTFKVERREDFIRKLASHGIPASVVHLRIDHNTVFGGIRDNLPGQAAFNASQISIPMHDALTDNDVVGIIAAIRSGW
jgi:perosamine synthetase